VLTCPASEVTPSRSREREMLDVTEPRELSDSWLPDLSRLNIRLVPTGIRLTDPEPRRADDKRETLDTGANRPNVGTHWKYLQKNHAQIITSKQTNRKLARTKSKLPEKMLECSNNLQRNANFY